MASGTRTGRRGGGGVPGPNGRRGGRGVTYVMVLMVLLIMGISTAVIGPVWHTEVRRDKEEELLFRLGEYRRALAQDPAFLRAWINLGNASLEAGKSVEAVAAYERAHELSPSNPEVLNNLAWALHLEPQSLDQAERLIRDALAQTPTPRHLYLDTLGAILVKKGALEEAGAVLEEGLRLAPPDDARGLAALSYHLGRLRLAQARPAEAVGFLRDAVRLDPRGVFGEQARRAMEPLADK